MKIGFVTGGYTLNLSRCEPNEIEDVSKKVDFKSAERHRNLATLVDFLLKNGIGEETERIALTQEENKRMEYYEGHGRKATDKSRKSIFHIGEVEVEVFWMAWKGQTNQWKSYKARNDDYEKRGVFNDLD